MKNIEIKDASFQFDERLMLEILGDNNFPDKYSPFIELIKNAYDACLPLEKKYTLTEEFKCEIDFDLENNSIIIKDNGIGMNEEDFLNKWLVVGKSEKKDSEEFKNYLGDKGIGRIAIHKISKNVQMITKKINCLKSVIWTTDWIENKYYTIEKDEYEHSTTFILKDLRQKWDLKEIDKLKKVISLLMYNVNNFKVLVNGEIVKNDFNKLIENQSFDYYISFNYENGVLSIDMQENEFDGDSLIEILPNYNYDKKYTDTKPIKDIIESYKKRNREGLDVNFDDNSDCGSFSGTLIFVNGKSNIFQSQRFHYLNKEKAKISNGILLYRDGFIIRPFGIDRKNDLFDIAGRVRRSPATQTKTDGRWRVRLNNITGVINLTKEMNPEIKDQSHRNGLEENGELKIFQIIVDEVIDYFERQRQDLTIAIDQYNKKINPDQDVEYDKIVKKMVKKAKDNEKIEITRDEVRAIALKNDLFNEEQINNNEDLKRMIYYTTQGLMTLSMYHEIKNNCEFLENFDKKIFESLKNANLYDELKNKYSKIKQKNFFKLINKMQDINNSNAFYSRKLLDEEKTSTFKDYISISEFIVVMENIIEKWKEKYPKLVISFTENMDIVDYKIKLTKSDLYSIVDNLVLNSLEANDNQCIISINVDFNDKHLILNYEDDGIGLNEKFKENPYEIFKYGVKGKRKGHGIGMWILKKIVDMNSSLINITKIEEGFGLELKIPFLSKK